MVHTRHHWSSNMDLLLHVLCRSIVNTSHQILIKWKINCSMNNLSWQNQLLLLYMFLTTNTESTEIWIVFVSYWMSVQRNSYRVFFLKKINSSITMNDESESMPRFNMEYRIIKQRESVVSFWFKIMFYYTITSMYDTILMWRASLFCSNYFEYSHICGKCISHWQSIYSWSFNYGF